jgi:hypothetical protein
MNEEKYSKNVSEASTGVNKQKQKSKLGFLKASKQHFFKHSHKITIKSYLTAARRNTVEKKNR